MKTQSEKIISDLKSRLMERLIPCCAGILNVHVKMVKVGHVVF